MGGPIPSSMQCATILEGVMAIVPSDITIENARNRFEQAAGEMPSIPDMEGKAILICAGGPHLPSAYVVVRLLRKFGVTLPIEIWHAGQNEIPDWARRAYDPWDITFHDVTSFYPERPLEEFRGWPIKTAALISSKFRHILFLDADCFPLRNPVFLLSSDEYQKTGSLFWPNMKYQFMIRDAKIWSSTGLVYRGDTEFESGILAIDKQRCWRELSLAQWINAHSKFWYDYMLGDKDTFYIAWRKLGTEYFLGPPCRRYRAVITRHFWVDGLPLVDHKQAAAKYGLPQRRGPFKAYLASHQYRPLSHNLYNEIMQRLIMRDFSEHARYLCDLAQVRESHLIHKDRGGAFDVERPGAGPR